MFAQKPSFCDKSEMDVLGSLKKAHDQGMGKD